MPSPLPSAQGVAFMSRQLIEDEVRAGRLMQPFGPEMEGKPFHLAYPGDPSG
jgi:LysR family transcriptional regulator, glycine cleavage system transcriptional activator